jgi:hypothetical protein
MDTSLRVVAAVIGLLLIFAFLRSAARVALVNRQSGDRLARRVGWVVHTALRRLAQKSERYEDVQDVLAWVLPLYVLLVVVAWFGLALAGFALLIWSTQAEHSLLKALIASGSQLSTLGFLTPQNTTGQGLAVLEGAFGLGVVVFYFTFIPGYQSAIQMRQVKVDWLYARAGDGLTNFALVEWFILSGANEWHGLWEEWESWFRNLSETHGLAPVLAFVPSVHRDQSWLAAAAVSLDSASFFLAAIEARGVPSANACRQTGIRALSLIAAEFADRRAASQELGPRRLSRADFDAACDRFASLGAKVKAERDVCWLRFVELRRKYEPFLQTLAKSLLVPTNDSLLPPLVA